MSEWMRFRVEEIAEKMAIGPFGSRMKSETYTQSGVPVIRGTNITGGRGFSGDWVYVSETDAGQMANCNVREGDLVFPHRGAIGEVGIVPGDKDRYIISSSLMTLRCDPTKANSLYLYYFFKSYKGRHELLKNSSQVGTPGIGQPLTSLRSIEVRLPSVEQQKAVAGLLGSLDNKIEFNRRMNDTLEAMARAIFQSWFVDFDPVRATAGGESPESICQRLGLTPELLARFPDDFEDSSESTIPAGWIQSTLGEQAKARSGFIQTGPFGSQLHAADYVDEGIPVVMPQDLVNRRISVAKVARITEEMAQRLSRHALQPGDVIYSRRGDVERHALVSERESGWLCGTGCLLVRLGQTWPSQAYLSEALDLPTTREWLVRHAVGATMPNLNTSILGDVPLLIPPAPLLEAFEQVAGVLRQQQMANSLESDSLAEARDALLPKLLNGELAPQALGELGA